MNPKSTTMDLKPPLGGLHRRVAYQAQPPFTTPDCENVWPFDTLEERGRIGSRAGLELAYDQELGSGSKVNLMAGVTRIRTDGLKFWTDNFEGATLGSVWSTASWIGTPPGITDEAFAAISYNGDAGAVRAALSDIDLTQAYQVQVYIFPYQSAHWGEYSLFVRMDDSNPAVTIEGVRATIRITGTGGTYTGTLTEFNGSVAGTTTFTGGSAGYAAPGWLTLHVNGTTCTVYWRGTQVAQRTVTSQSGGRFGLGIECTETDGLSLVDAFRIQYHSSVSSETRWNMLVAGSGGTLYRELLIGELTALTTSLTLNATHQLVGIERGQKLYILDYDAPVVTGDDGNLDATGLLLDATSVSDWSDLGANADDYVVVLSGSLPKSTDGVYEIDSLAAGEVTLARAGDANASCHYRIERGPKVYDPAEDTLTLWTSTSGEGYVPVGCRVGELYRDRLVLAAPENAPHMWYMSKQGDPRNWDYDEPESGVQSAVHGASAEAGRVGRPVNALLSHNDDILIIGCDDDSYVMRGDPNYQGQLDNLSQEIGIVDKFAACRTPEGTLIMLSRDGIYSLEAGANTFPEPLSRQKLPKELKDIDRTLYSVSMVFDLRFYGIHIYVTPNDARDERHYFFDWSTKSFWPVTLQTDHEPFTLLAFHSQDAEFTSVLHGGRDGYIRRYHHESELDGGGNAIASYCVYGPLLLGRNGRTNGKIVAMDGTLDEDSGQVRATLHLGDTAEAALAASLSKAYTWKAGLNYTNRPQRTDHAAALKLTGHQSGRAWAVENITLEIAPAGPRRKL